MRAMKNAMRFVKLLSEHGSASHFGIFLQAGVGCLGSLRRWSINEPNFRFGLCLVGLLSGGALFGELFFQFGEFFFDRFEGAATAGFVGAESG